MVTESITELTHDTETANCDNHINPSETIFFQNRNTKHLKYNKNVM